MVEADAQVVRAGRRFPEVGRWFPKSASVAGRFRKRGETKRDEANGSPQKKDGHIVGGRPDFFMLSFEQMQFFCVFFVFFVVGKPVFFFQVEGSVIFGSEDSMMRTVNLEV